MHITTVNSVSTTINLIHKLDNFWHFIVCNSKPSTLFYEEDDSVYSLSLVFKNTDGNINKIRYCFQEEANALKAHFVCYGEIVLDISPLGNTIISSTVVDKYNDNFEPDIRYVLETFFEIV